MSGRTATGASDALLPVYKKPDMLFVSGEGSWLIAEDGRRYLDFTAGIGVNALGHGAPEVAGAIREWLETGLIHTSNLFRTEPGERLAEELVAATFPARVFFCNSGAEAGEGAFKLARRWDGLGIAFCVISDGYPDEPDKALGVAKGFTSKIDTVYVGPEDESHGRDFLRRLAAAAGGQHAAAARVFGLVDALRPMLAAQN